MHARAPAMSYAHRAGAAAAGVRGSRRPDPHCLKCAETGKTVIELKCAMHYLCKDCLQQKTREEGWEEMYVCRKCAAAERSEPPVYVFVDHANLWIEAKRLGKGKKRLALDCSEDHRVRINYGHLQDVIVPEGQRVVGKIYTTDQLDFESEAFKVEQLALSGKSGKKQKKVDTTIVRDILRLLRTVPYSKRTTVVLISGDADMIPALEDIAEEKIWKVIIYSWDHCRAANLHDFQLTRSNVSIVSLDEHWDTLVYYNRCCETISITDDDRNNSSLVLQLSFPRGFVKDWKIDCTKWWTEIEKVSKWSVQYKWLTENESIRYLLLLFKGMSKIDTKSMVGRITTRLTTTDFKIERCETYLSYKERLKRNPAKHVTRGQKYSDMARQK
jgi:uncharacterized LabA/DUF88 family protein